MNDLRPAGTIEHLIASHRGRYLLGPNSLSFIVDAHLAGLVLWGRLGGEQVRELARLHERLRPSQVPHAALLDVRHLGGPDPAAFNAVIDYVADRGSRLAEIIIHLAVVRPDGIVGATAAGFFDVSPKPLTTKLFTDVRGALAWLERSDVDGLSRGRSPARC